MENLGNNCEYDSFVKNKNEMRIKMAKRTFNIVGIKLNVFLISKYKYTVCFIRRMSN